MKKRIVSNALRGWAQAVALSAGDSSDLCQEAYSEATVQVFQAVREVSCNYANDGLTLSYSQTVWASRVPRQADPFPFKDCLALLCSQTS